MARDGPGIGILLHSKQKSEKVCKFWTCRNLDTKEYDFVDYEGLYQKVNLCFEHRGRMAGVKARFSDMDILVSPEGWLWIDTFGWHLKHESDKNS